jgi:hypothetical protein
MANVMLPGLSIPEWAKEIPEEKWKENLLQKIRSRDRNQ